MKNGNWEYRFLVESTKLKTRHFHAKLPRQKPMLRQIEWRVQNGPITKNGVLPVTALYFLKILFQFKSLLQRVDMMCQLPKCPYLHFLQALELHLRVLFYFDYPYFDFIKEMFSVISKCPFY